ncbi:LytR C-terminal domain-containing protein [Saccharothrix syringae]|uniref:LytR family transcriptional regulator n=1 Tax=Saccharothrix syringae TaxID=103733 RepID=A0A5Q0GRY0_SACSY|nr:LytR C-terminal domain-containing protein [Saccharothrix syringae]QFZ16435.1 LytR family transcriptional regulator [Saccharothrix syringae]
MTNPEQPAGTAHPARAAGYVLLGLAAVALVIGVISLFGGGSDDQPPAAQTTATSTPGSDTQSSAPPSETTPATSQGEPTTTQPPQAPTTTPAPTGAPTTPGTPAGQGTADTPPPPVAPKPPVRVYNNGTIAGLAADASNDVRRGGWEVVDTANYSQGTIPTTTVYFRPGTDEEASARQLAQFLNARVEPRFNGIQAAHAGIIVIVTNDYKGPSGKVS